MSGADPVAYVVSLNLRRRHLDESQRALVAARIANLQHGGDRSGKQAANFPLGPSVAQADAAKMLNVSDRSVRSAVAVRDHAVPSLVERGEVSVSAAAAVARLPEPEQEAIVAKGEREILDAACPRKRKKE